MPSSSFSKGADAESELLFLQSGNGRKMIHEESISKVDLVIVIFSKRFMDPWSNLSTQI